MSFIRATNSSLPNLVGFSLIAGGVFSALSTWATNGAVPILNFPGSGIADFAFSVVTAITGYYIVKEGSAVAAWLAGALVATSLVYVGVSINADQAGRMATATIQSAQAAANTAAAVTANGRLQDTANGNHWRAVKRLNPQQIAECEAGVLSWTKTETGIRNCTPATDGVRYVWKRQ